MYRQDKGGLSSGVSGNKPKIIIEWEFWSSREKKVTVQVRLRNDPGGGLSLKADCSMLPETVYGTDIDELYKRVEKILQDQEDLFTGIIWEDWLELKIQGGNNIRDGGLYGLERTSELKMEYASIKRGIGADGKIYHVNCNGIVLPFPEPRRLADGEHSKVDGFRTESAAEISYVPATEANLAALERLRLDMATLRHRIADLVSQDRIQATLELARTAPARLQYHTPEGEN